MKYLITALCLLAMPVTAQHVAECDWQSGARNIAEPWGDNTETFGNDDVRLALLDTIEPAAAAFHLLVLSPPYTEVGDRQCRVISFSEGYGFFGIYFAQLKASYDPKTGLTFKLPIRVYSQSDHGSDPAMLTVTLNQSTGDITASYALD